MSTSPCTIYLASQSTSSSFDCGSSHSPVVSKFKVLLTRSASLLMTFSPLNYLFNPQRRFCGHKIQSSLPTPVTQPIVDTQDLSAAAQVLPLHQQSQGENLTAPQDLDHCPQSPQPAQMPQTAEINLQRQCLTLNFVPVLMLQYGFGKG